jgi:adenine-specific DNA-methyltransferase
MPTLDWLNRERALAIAGAVPYRLLEHVSSHGDAAAGIY